jgi:hypothetical protein
MQGARMPPSVRANCLPCRRSWVCEAGGRTGIRIVPGASAGFGRSIKAPDPRPGCRGGNKGAVAGPPFQAVLAAARLPERPKGPIGRICPPRALTLCSMGAETSPARVLRHELHRRRARGEGFDTSWPYALAAATATRPDVRPTLVWSRREWCSAFGCDDGAAPVADVENDAA